MKVKVSVKLVVILLMIIGYIQSNRTKIINYNYKNLNLSKNYSLIFDFGSYEAKSIVDNSKSIVLNRNGLSSSFIHEYKILIYKDLMLIINYHEHQGLFINSRIERALLR